MNSQWIWIVSLVISGCASKGVIVDEVMLPLNTIKQVVVGALPNGLRDRSQNGRALTSNYYDPYNPLKERFDNARKRSQAEVFILGDHRPYSVQVLVHVERRRRTPKGRVYERVGRDKKAEEALGLRMKLRLSKAKGTRDFIDEFRPF